MSERAGALSKLKHRQVLELAQKGIKNEEIARQLALSVGTVKNFRSRSLAVAGAPLSTREAEVSELARKGLTTKAIAVQLGLSSRTVEIHRQRALKKLSVRNPAELATKQVDSLIARIGELEAKVAHLEEQLEAARNSS